MATDQDDHIKLDNTKRSKLRKAIKATGLSPFRLLKSVQNVPKGLTSSTISKACDNVDGTDYIDRRHFEFLINLSTRLAKERKELAPDYRYWLGKKRKPISDEYLEELKAEMRRTGRSIESVLKRCKAIEKPSADSVRGWVTGDIATAIPSDMGLVLKEYQQYPVKQKQGEKLEAITPDLKNRVGYEPICEQDLTTLRRYRKKTGILPSIVFRESPKPPEGLTHHMVQLWLDGKTKSAKAEHIKWVLHQSQRLLKEVLDLG